MKSKSELALWRYYPLLLALLSGKNKAERKRIKQKIIKGARDVACVCDPFTLAVRMQDQYFPAEARDTEKVSIILVSEQEGISGGVFSFFSIANQLRRLKMRHGYTVLVMTCPSPSGQTYFRNRFFTNNENVFRFEQITQLRNVKNLYIHIPEYFAAHFLGRLNRTVLDFLKQVPELSLNIFNQNIDLMPEQTAIEELRGLTTAISQSTAHHSYSTQEVCDRFNLPLITLPAYTDLSAYPSSAFEDKEDLIIYSPDICSQKEDILTRIATEFPHYKLVEIKGISFDRFMELATRCRFSITFGEGFDGYLAQPIHQGGMGLAIYNDRFFPSENLITLGNIFRGEEDMLARICSVIRTLEANKESYTTLNAQWMAEYRRLYNFDYYVAQIERLAIRDFDFYPEGQ